MFIFYFLSPHTHHVPPVLPPHPARSHWPYIQNLQMSRNDIKRIEGAMMGYNSLEPPMELWRDANWGNSYSRSFGVYSI